jgi:hypothetical protein
VREQQRLGVAENKVRRISGPKRGEVTEKRKLHNDELYGLNWIAYYC